MTSFTSGLSQNDSHKIFYLVSRFFEHPSPSLRVHHHYNYNMEDILESILGYHSISPSKARKLHHLSHTPPEYWTAEERMLSGKARTQWLREVRKRAHKGGNLATLDRIWPTGPYWPNGGVLPGGEATQKEFRKAVGRMRYLDQAVSPSVLSISSFDDDLSVLSENPPAKKVRQVSNQADQQQQSAIQFSLTPPLPAINLTDD